MREAPSAILRQKWLDALLPSIPFDGWTQGAADLAAREAGLSREEQAFAAPRGILDLLEAFFDAAEAETSQKLATTDLSDMRIRDKVAIGIQTWLGTLAPHKEAVRRAVARGFLPWSAPAAAGRTWSVADMIWTACGDTSEDYNRYTKRGLLAGVVPAIVLKWLDEDDEDAVRAHIDRNIERAMRTGQFGGKLLGPLLKRFG